ncbi:MAG: hypothetical protein WBM32_06450 [Crocosphaera sp.]
MVLTEFQEKSPSINLTSVQSRRSFRCGTSDLETSNFIQTPRYDKSDRF